MTPTQIYLLIAVMALVTYLIRVLPMVLIRRQIRNRFLRSFLYYVPYVTLSAMTFPAILQATGVWWAGALALGTSIFAALRTRSLFFVALVACATVSGMSGTIVDRIKRTNICSSLVCLSEHIPPRSRLIKQMIISTFPTTHTKHKKPTRTIPCRLSFFTV